MTNYEVPITELELTETQDDLTQSLRRELSSNTPRRTPSKGLPTTPEDMHNRRVHFGKYKDELWTRVPLAYLRWCANQLNDPAKTLAEMELERRGTKVAPGIELSGHSVDRASETLLDIWQEDRGKREGIHSWLARRAQEAYDQLGIESYHEASDGEETKDVETTYRGIRMVFMVGRYYPVLKTCMPRD